LVRDVSVNRAGNGKGHGLQILVAIAKVVAEKGFINLHEFTILENLGVHPAKGG
tara:strand:- start:370 stop:531 length:162 start_codon:yes stop_codon:yes gene_type:complete